MLKERASGPRGSARTERLTELASVAALIFLTLMVAAAVLLVAGKLQFPSLGAGAGPFDVLRAIGLIALATLGVTIDLDGLELNVVPLGALALVAGAAVTMSRQFVRSPARTASDISIAGLGLGLLALLGAFVFRFGGEAPVSASPAGALVLGTGWGMLFLGVAIAHSDPGRIESRRLPALVADALPEAWRALKIGVYGSLVALLCFLIARLAADPLPRSFGLGDAAAAFIYLVAFVPNVLVAIFSLAVGATLDVGAQFDVGGRMVGPLRTISLWDWGNAAPVRWLLIALPIVMSIAVGLRSAKKERTFNGVASLVVPTAVIVAVAVGAVAAIGDARLGAGLVRQNGVGLVAVNAGQAAALTFLWIAAGGIITASITQAIGRRRGR